MRDFHFKKHPYIKPEQLGFVKLGEEPNRDKYGHYEAFLGHFGLNVHDESELEIDNIPEEVEKPKPKMKRSETSKIRK